MSDNRTLLARLTITEPDSGMVLVETPPIPFCLSCDLDPEHQEDPLHVYVGRDCHLGGSLEQLRLLHARLGAFIAFSEGVPARVTRSKRP